jgi:peptidoglycan/LPS O-acetylase OafA/YrhL
VVLPLREGRAVRLLDTRSLAALGVVSYSLYLWHFPLIGLLARHLDAGFAGLLAFALLICVPVAVASYFVIERPFLRLRRRWAGGSG